MNTKTTWNSGALYDANTRNERALGDEDRAKGLLRRDLVQRIRAQRDAQEERAIASAPREVWEE
ncbi:hypothetical protein [Jeongeupia sp. USM3]|uniref:hypothetical protein n=1 Tax=Jeongeupia sp. USM3 TaxID=1906741 RepID=UPI00089DE7C6|nr:hypothetical protein [Jeongeupia sp. USM3]AOX99104.1 hypothetical protein BJP62_00735 [Jeongeupia sp. USM3]